MTQAQTDDLTIRLDEQHDELLRRLDELDSKIADVLNEWAESIGESVEKIDVDASEHVNLEKAR